MVVLTWQEKLFYYSLIYGLSAITMPLGGIWKILRLLYLFLEDVFRPRNTPERHAEKVKYVQKQVVDWNLNGRKTKMCTARPGWKTLSVRIPIYKDTLVGIHIDMDDIVQIDPIKRVVTVEPMMTMGRLTSILTPMGWTLPVVPELDDLTVGGLLCGAGIETSSHKYGLFQHICLSMEVVLASGEVVICSKEKHSDLFYSMPLSCGTLGFLTSAELMLIPAKQYVKLEYIPVHSTDEAISTFETQTFKEFGNEFVEGIMYSLDQGVIMVGNMASEAEPGKVNSIGRWYKPGFYKHVETFLKKNPSENFVEYIPLRDYYHRHTRNIFWELAHIVPYTNNIVFRYLCGWILPLSVSLIKAVATGFILRVCCKNHVAQDFLVPLDKLKESLLLCHEEMKTYPVWLCPAKFIKEPGMARPRRSEKDFDIYVDIGVYGMCKQKEYEIVKSARRLELYCIENYGYQALYADVCMTREEFEQMFDLQLYKKVREDLNCSDAFPEVYDKVCWKARR